MNLINKNKESVVSPTFHEDHSHWAKITILFHSGTVQALKDLYNLEKADIIVYRKLRENLWVRAFTVFMFVKVSIVSDSWTLNDYTPLIWGWNHHLCKGIWILFLSLNLHLRQLLQTWESLVMVRHNLNIWVHNSSLHK